MSELLFNFNDQILVIIMVVCLLHTVIVFLQTPRKAYHYLLIGFLMTLAIGALDTLVSWSNALKLAYQAYTPHLYFILKCCWFIQGPLLYLFSKSVIFEDHQVWGRDLLHLCPGVLYLAWLPLLYHFLGEEALHMADSQYHVLYQNWAFKCTIFFSELSLFGYACASYFLLRKHKHELSSISSNTDGIDATWLRYISIGFVLLWGSRVSTELALQIEMFVTVANAIGLFHNYFEVLLINFLVFSAQLRASRVRQLRLDQGSFTEKKGYTPPNYTDEQVDRLQRVMSQNKPYLNPDLNIDQLSDLTSLPLRVLSAIINRHFQKNFFEFVNHYRIEHAKALLMDDKRKYTVLQVVVESGFNSKSAFNRVFRQLTSQTPTQFRQHHSQKSVPVS